jgi:hypothetical protein
MIVLANAKSGPFAAGIPRMPGAKNAFTNSIFMQLYQASTILQYIVLTRRMSSQVSKKELPGEVDI